jgi:hypothetical protein
MSLSKERTEYHLTPEGWVEGSFYGDALGGRVIRDTPEDRVLTIDVVEELPSAFSSPMVYDQISWESKDRKQIDRCSSDSANAHQAR